MSAFTEAYEDAFSMLCGTQLGRGMSRTVFHCTLLPDCVVKVETEHSTFQNVLEWQTWCTVQHTDHSEWFAPCEWISPNGKVLIQRRTFPVGPAHLPTKMPAWFTDFKVQNYGMIPRKGKQPARLVCHDYGTSLALQEGTTTRRMKAPMWYDGPTGRKLRVG
jgi:hypothetical protein